MARSFSEGILDGFNVIETARDRRASRAIAARDLSLREAANSRAEIQLGQNTETLRRAREKEDLNSAALSAFARIRQNPDDPSAEDMAILEQAGFHDEVGQIRNRQEVSGASRTVIGHLGLPDVAAVGAGVGSQATQQPSNLAAQPQSAGAQAFLDVSREETLPGNRFATESPRRVKLQDVFDYLPDDERQAIQDERRAAERSAMRDDLPLVPKTTVNQRIEIPPGVMTTTEIQQLLPSEQEAAIKRNRELLGNRESELDRIARGPAEARSMVDRYKSVFNHQVGSEMRSLAESAPSIAVQRYAQDRASLMAADPNTAALMDRWIQEPLQNSIAHIQRYVRDSIPRTESGEYDWDSQQAKDAQARLDTNIALLAAVDKDFNLAREAGIRAGAFPVGNEQLVGQITEGIQSGPQQAARPMTPEQQRLTNTRMQRFDQQTQAAPAKRIPNGVLDAMHTLYLHGRMTLEQIENVARTGRLDPATASLIQVSPKNDLYLSDGTLVRLGYDEEAAREVQQVASEESRETVTRLLGGAYDASPRSAAEQEIKFWTYVRNRAPYLLEENGIDVRNMSVIDTQALLMRYMAEERATNAQDRSIKSWFQGPFREGRPPFGDEAGSRARELGIETPDLGGRQFDEVDAIDLRRQMLATGIPALTAAASMSPQQLAEEVSRYGNNPEEFVNQLLQGQ